MFNSLWRGLSDSHREISQRKEDCMKTIYKHDLWAQLYLDDITEHSDELDDQITAISMGYA